MPHFKPSGPLSIQGAPVSDKSAKADIPVFRLKVVDKAQRIGSGAPALLSSTGLDALTTSLFTPSGLLSLASGSDCILTVRLDDSIPEGCIALDDVQQHNLHLVPGEHFNFKIFQPPEGEPFDLVDLEAEVRLLASTPTNGAASATVEVDAERLAQLFAKQCFGRTLAVTESVLVDVDGSSVVLRVTAVNTLTEAEQEEAVAYHCYRGCLTPDTAIYLRCESSGGDPGSCKAAAPAAAVPPPAGTPGSGSAAVAIPGNRQCRQQGEDKGEGEGGLEHSVFVDARAISGALEVGFVEAESLLDSDGSWVQIEATTSISRSRPTPGSGPLPQDAYSFQVHGAQLFAEVLRVQSSKELSDSDLGLGLEQGASSSEGKLESVPEPAAAGVRGCADGEDEGSGAVKGKGLGAMAAEAANGTGLAAEGAKMGNGSNGAGVEGALPALVLQNPRRRADRPPPTNVCHVTTRDGEWFPVKKKLLRPCIALTQFVRNTDTEAPSFPVDVDTLTFDRVLIFLEALALDAPPPTFGIHLLDDLLQAAKVLGLRPLQDMCEQRLGAAAAQVRVWRFQEVEELNAQGGCWLILDGMVLDVTRWLPEHPGGSRIIPAQALNMDCARFFEMYHASRESFVYLKEFYMGELDPQDRDQVPRGSVPPSVDFLAQLREYTTFRLSLEAAEAPPAFKSF